MLGYVLRQQASARTSATTSRSTVTRTTSRASTRTNVSFGNSTVMFPLSKLQAMNRLSGQVSLGFVQVDKGASIPKVRAAIDDEFPQLTTIQIRSDYGRADRNLTLISAANTGGSILAAMIAITGVLNTSLLSFFERIREFGIYRSIGWTRLRVISLVLGEALIVSLGGAVLRHLLHGLGRGQRAAAPPPSCAGSSSRPTTRRCSFGPCCSACSWRSSARCTRRCARRFLAPLTAVRRE